MSLVVVAKAAFVVVVSGVIGTLVMWSKDGESHRHNDATAVTDGYHGPIDATMDWCESNYVVTPYVAEFFNTVSSLPMIVLGLVGVALERRYATGETRIALAFLGLATVGVGSALFHATLRFHYQLMDELPMLYVNQVFIYCQQRYDKPSPARGAWDWLAIGLVALSAAQTFCYVYLGLYTVFIVSYAAGVLCQWYFFLFQRGGFAALSPEMRRFFILLVVCYKGGFVLWALEHVFCGSVRPFQFHAWWHLGAGYGTYCWCVFLVMVRCEYLLKRRAKKKEDGADATVTLECFGVHYALMSDKV